MPHDQPPKTGASPKAIKQGFEPLGTHTAGVWKTLAIFFLAAGLMLWGLFALLELYETENIRGDLPESAAPILTQAVRSPLEPMPEHNDLDWQDLVHVRQREDDQFRAMGWQIDPHTGEPTIPAAVASAVMARYAGGGDLAEAHPLRFPPTMAPVPAGPQESLPRANVFPPVGSFAAAQEVKPSGFVPPPGPPNIKKYPPGEGPAGQQNNPTSEPAH